MPGSDGRRKQTGDWTSDRQARHDTATLSRRDDRTLVWLADRYPVAARPYDAVGYHLDQEFTGYHRVGSREICTGPAEETPRVFDHPKAKASELEEEQTRQQLLAAVTCSRGAEPLRGPWTLPADLHPA